MAHKRLRVIATRRLPAAVEADLAARFDFTPGPAETPLAGEALGAALGRAQVLVTTLSERIDAAALEKAGKALRLLANYGAGVDHIDVAAAAARGIAVTNTPDVVTEDTADVTMVLILAVTRRLPEAFALLQSGGWEGWSPDLLLGGRIHGRSLGILGMGRIGQAVARRAAAFGMRIGYHSRNRLPRTLEAELGARWWPSLDQMVAQCDVLSINCPHTPATYHLVNARRIALMKPGAVVVNTSRGEVIDENALTRALRAGEIAGAGLDVFEQRREINPRLRALPNVVLLPHMGSATVEGRLAMGERVIANIEALAQGVRLPDLVTPRDV
ncbi:2-hydroxyacid dehydrogenase [Limimaricola cinnabarinus]|jgi:glyoxylate reductase|uniref:D-glycerate dehydrogenase n=1 Tax=Limimaricola cinnabarinus TaxID=1125964 RepID=A0A2G1MIU7_9RHOB|nr:D-glycerate dehydrogenase [Limimaricola cinnabarinus]PHP28624.1 D-glycerate dehydrogenase [Limimaricola cinnabarinus]